MKIKVKLFGTLGQRFPDYSPEKGLEVEISEGAEVGALLAHLRISNHQEGIVVQEGRFLSQEEKLTNGALVQVFQAMYGG
jgi:sulfur carrier protein ThiS